MMHTAPDYMTHVVIKESEFSFNSPGGSDASMPSIIPLYL